VPHNSPELAAQTLLALLTFGWVETNISSYRSCALVLNFMVCLSFLAGPPRSQFWGLNGPRTSILRSKCRPWRWSSWCFFGDSRRALWSSRGGLGIPRERSWDHFGGILGRFWEGFWTIFFVRGGRQNLALCCVFFFQHCFYASFFFSGVS